MSRVKRPSVGGVEWPGVWCVAEELRKCGMQYGFQKISDLSLLSIHNFLGNFSTLSQPIMYLVSHLYLYRFWI